MNIFVLDLSPQVCAQMHCNSHNVKMVIETTQLLSTTLRMHGINYGYRETHRSHPCRKWLDKSLYNFMWLQCLGLELCQEYTYRYGKRHKTQSVLEDMPYPSIPDVGLTNFALAMPPQYHHKDPVQAYRNYYIGAKIDLLV